MSSDYDIREGKLIYVTGPEAGKEIAFESDRLVLDNTMSIDRVKNLYLLRSLTGEEVLVSGKKVREKILESNDRLVLSNSEIEFRPIQVLLPTKTGIKNQQALRSTLFLLVIAAVALIAWNQYKVRSAAEGAAPGPTKALQINADTAPVKAPTRPTLDLSARIKLARVEFEMAERLYKDRSVTQGNLYAAIQAWERVADLLKEESQEDPLVAGAKERLGVAKLELKTELEYLYKNAFVANTIGDRQALSAILRQIMRTYPDPSDRQYYQWAQKKLFSSPGKPPAKG